MTDALFLLQLAGEAALLLWGLHMVQTGVLRAYGGKLQARLGEALRSPLRAVAAGMVVTTVLQSSTATALMLGAFAAAGAVALLPALAVMLGANLGTALIVQALSLDVAWLAPALVLLGVVVFRTARRPKGRDLGRVAIGLGLMLLSLHLLGQTLAPLASTRWLPALMGELRGAPIAALLLGAVLAWAAHSSIAGVLFIASFAATGALAPAAAVAMVLGANVGTALTPLLQARGAPGGLARYRLSLGNLLNRLVGAVLGLWLLGPFLGLLGRIEAEPERLVVHAHLAFNIATALLAFPLLGLLARLLTRWLPEPDPMEDPAQPRHLDPSAIAMPSVALTNATRELLRMADVLEGMIGASARSFASEERQMAKELARRDDVVDRLHHAVQAYLAEVEATGPGDAERARLAELRGFAIALEQAADVLSRDVAQQAAKRQRRGVLLSAADLSRIEGVHAALVEQLRLAIAVLMMEDVAAGQRLVAAKESLRETERAAARDMAAAATRLAEEGGLAPGLVLDAVRDLRRVGAHLASVAHPLLERRGLLLPSRLMRPA